MSLVCRARRGRAGLWLVALVSLGPAAARGAEAPGTPAQGKGEEIDAELLRDLEVLNNANYARDREIAKRLSLLERLRMLQGQLPPGSDQSQAGTGPPPPPASRGR